MNLTIVAIDTFMAAHYRKGLETTGCGPSSICFVRDFSEEIGMSNESSVDKVSGVVAESPRALIAGHRTASGQKRRRVQGRWQIYREIEALRRGEEPKPRGIHPDVFFHDRQAARLCLIKHRLGDPDDYLVWLDAVRIITESDSPYSEHGVRRLSYDRFVRALDTAFAPAATREAVYLGNGRVRVLGRDEPICVNGPRQRPLLEYLVSISPNSATCGQLLHFLRNG